MRMLCAYACVRVVIIAMAMMMRRGFPGLRHIYIYNISIIFRPIEMLKRRSNNNNNSYFNCAITLFNHARV